MGSFEIRRDVRIDADPALVHRLVNDLHEWADWSPWEGADPDLQRSYSGARAGVGAHYAWSGNRRAGRGTMEITASTPERIELTLSFERPFRAVNDVVFTLTPDAGGTAVVWTMTGRRGAVASVLTRVLGVDRLVGRDFDRGLARLRASAEA